MARKPAKSKRVTSHEPRAALSEQAVREAAQQCDDLAAAGERLGVADLAGRLGRSKKLQAAWDRGRLLRRVREVAAGPLVPEAADKDLGLPKGTLVAMLKTDMIVRELWTDTRFVAIQKVRQSVMDLAAQGEARAVAAFEKIIEIPAHAGPPDFGRVKGADLREATGILREQWLRWVRESGCPQNTDSTFSLPRIIDWLRRWERDQAGGGSQARGLNPLQAQKAELLAIEKRKRLGRLVDVTIHVSELANRAQALAGLIAPARAHDLAQSLVGKPLEEIEQILAAAYRAVLDAYRRLTPDIPIEDAAREKIEQGLTLIVEGTSDEHKGATHDG